MSDSLMKFSQKGFSRGVNDTLTLKPIRDAIKDVARQVTHVHSKGAGKGSSVSGGDRGQNPGKPTRKAG